ncbi:MAG: 3'-5' exonuclease [Treponema sp.]|nr:3'-5' exonuclease [Treponema sp.]
MNNRLDYIAIDFETANYCKNSACSVGLVRFIDGKETDSCYSLIHPAKMYFIPEWTRDIHHISYDDVRNKPYFPEVWDTIVMPFIKQTPDIPLVAHNGNTFDIPVIQNCCNYYDMELPKLEYFDSLTVARKTWPELENHKLTQLGEYLGIKYLAHDALEDSRTCGKIISFAANKWKVNSIEELLKACNTNIRSF